MSQKFFRVRAVPGRRIMDPTTLGQATPRVVGYHRTQSERTQINWFTKQVEPEIDLVLTGEDVLVPAVAFFRQAIADGDLEYVENVERHGDKESARVEPALKTASDKHKASRASLSADVTAEIPPALSPVPSPSHHSKEE